MTRRLAALAALVTALCACAPTPSGGTYQLASPVTDRGVTLGAGTLTFGAERVDMALTVSFASCSEPAMVTASAQWVFNSAGNVVIRELSCSDNHACPSTGTVLDWCNGAVLVTGSYTVSPSGNTLISRYTPPRLEWRRER